MNVSFTCHGDLATLVVLKLEYIGEGHEGGGEACTEQNELGKIICWEKASNPARRSWTLVTCHWSGGASRRCVTSSLEHGRVTNALFPRPARCRGDSLRFILTFPECHRTHNSLPIVRNSPISLGPPLSIPGCVGLYCTLLRFDMWGWLIYFI